LAAINKLNKTKVIQKVLCFSIYLLLSKNLSSGVILVAIELLSQNFKGSWFIAHTKVNFN